jgi:3-deoxy-D-manno-octulosonate 8-phosphate phosphatase (KDO 8-P phosphatase)
VSENSQQCDEELAAPIKMILSDVDGVMTDGTIVLDNLGVETKSFHVRDGMAIKLWQRAGFHFGLLTARNSQIVKIRAAELKIPIVRQGFSDKWPAAKEIFSEVGVLVDEVCYIGDDLPDVPVLMNVGLSATVADAANEALDASTWVTQKPGGKGAVRELIERLMKAKGCWEAALTP